MPPFNRIEAHLQAAQQYFPNYKLDPKRTEIGLREYDLAAKALEGDQRSLTAAAGIALFFGGTGATILSSQNLSPGARVVTELGGFGLAAISAVVISVALLLSHYFARLQRSATYAARKIVVLRRLMGLDYGNIETVLPADTLAGANEPYAIKMFPGWSSLQAIPVLAVALLSAFVHAALIISFDVEFSTQHIGVRYTSLITGCIAFLLISALYRISLFEDYENLRLFLTDKIAKILGTPLKRRVGHVLYRLRLAISESERVGIKLSQMFDILIDIEDRYYYKHSGNSLRAVASSIRRFFKYRARSGASTIAHQLVRSNFLSNLDRKLRRKILEWCLAPWLYTQFNRNDLLKAYLVSVRYAGGVFGIVEALRYFFPYHRLSDDIPPYMRFILVERLSNVSRSFPRARVQRLVSSCRKKGLLSEEDIPLLNSAYTALEVQGCIDLRGHAPALA